MDRVNKSMKNLIFALIKYLTLTVLTFVVRAIFARKLDAAYLGVNGLFTNILSVLSIVELGVGSSIVYSMYKVVANDDKEQINSLLYLYKKIYLIIATIIITIGFSLMPFLPYLVDTSEIPSINIYIAYLIFLIDSAISYFAAYRRSVIFIYQRSDVESKIGIVKVVFLNVAQIIVLLTSSNFYLYLIMMPFATLLDGILIILFSKKMYPDIKPVKGCLKKETAREISVNTKATLIHKIGGVVVYSTDNILISSIVGLAVLGAYTNYYVIVSALVSFVGLVATSVKSSVGNYIAIEEKEKAKNLFDKLTFLFMCLSIFCSVCYFCIANSFIFVWVGEKYVLSTTTVLLISISLFLNLCKSTNNLYKDCSGLMDKDKYRVIYEIIINLAMSIILGRVMGINGIILGTIISTVAGPLITEPFVVYKYYFKTKFLDYVKQFFKYFIILVITGCFTYGVSSLIPSGNILLLMAKIIVACLTCACVMIGFFWRNSYFKEYLHLLKRIMFFNINRKKDN